MKTKFKVIWCVVAGLVSCGIQSATDRGVRPTSGTYYSAQRKQPPLPFNPFPELPLTSLGNNRFVYDDRGVDYGRLQREAAMAEPQGGEMQPLNGGLGDCGGTDLHICSLTVAGDNVHLVLANAVPGEAYDVFFTPTLNPGFYWRLHFRGAANQTEFDVAKPESPNGFYIVGTAKDTDEDELTDGYEALVTHTTTTAAPVYNSFDLSDGNKDFDGDGLSNAEEFSLRTLGAPIPTAMDSAMDQRAERSLPTTVSTTTATA